MLDNLTMTQFVHNADARIRGADACADPDRFFIAARLAAKHLAPKPAEHFPFDIWHGYHFDAVLLGQFLHKKALQRGVRYQTAHVTHANLDEQRRHRLGEHPGRPARSAPICSSIAPALRACSSSGIEDALCQLLGKFVQRRGGCHADSDRHDDTLRDGLDRHEARLGVEDSAHRALRQRLCL